MFKLTTLFILICILAQSTQFKSEACDFDSNNQTTDCKFSDSKYITAFNSKTFNGCFDECLNKIDCTRYSFVNGLCILFKSSFKLSDLVISKNVYSGFIGDRVTLPIAQIIFDENNFAKNCDFFGNDLERVDGPLDNCLPECLKNSNCTHYVYKNNMCYLKYGNVSQANASYSFDTKIVCVIMNFTKEILPIVNPFGISSNQENSHGINFNGMNFAKGCDFSGNDFVNFLGSSEDCENYCAQLTGLCTHYVWTRLNNGTCFLKSGNVSVDDATNSTDSTSVCGILLPSKKIALQSVYGYYTLKDTVTNRFLESNNLGYAFTNPKTGSFFQSWLVVLEYGYYFRLINRATGLCLENYPGQNVRTAPCLQIANQLWGRTSSNQIINYYNRFCLDSNVAGSVFTNIYCNVFAKQWLFQIN